MLALLVAVVFALAGCTAVDPAQAPYHHAAQTLEAEASFTPACNNGEIMVLNFFCASQCPAYRVTGVGTVTWWYEPNAHDTGNAEARERLGTYGVQCTKWRRDDCRLCWKEGDESWPMGIYVTLSDGTIVEHSIGLESEAAARQEIRMADPPTLEE